MVSGPRREALRQAGRPLPEPVVVSALIDTGASGTVVDPAVIKKLQIPATGITHIGTPSTGAGSHPCNQYDAAVAIILESGQLHVVENLAVVEAELAQFGFEALLGRDVLAHGLLVFNGTNNSITVAF